MVMVEELEKVDCWPNIRQNVEVDDHDGGEQPKKTA